MEYTNTVWSLYFWIKENRVQLQHCAAELVPLLSDKSYHHHLADYHQNY